MRLIGLEVKKENGFTSFVLLIYGKNVCEKIKEMDGKF